MTWESWSLQDSVAVDTLSTVGDAVAPVVSAVESVLEIVKAVVEFSSKLVIDIPDLQTTAIKAAIDTVRAVLEDLVGDAGCYFLPIPVHLKNVVATEDLIYSPTPGGPEPATTSNVFLPPVGGGGGGNYGFLNDLINSLNDRKDILRPMFDEDAHIAGMVVIAGADSYLDILPLIEKLKRLFSGKKKSGAGEGIGSTDGASILKVKNLKAEIVPSVIGQATKIRNRLEGGASTNPYAVRLSWDLDDRIQVILKDPFRYTFTIKKIQVYRSEKPISVYDGQAVLYQYKLKDFEFDGLTSTFYDDTIELGTTYYYAVGYEKDSKAEALKDERYTLWSESTSSAVAESITDILVPTEINMIPRSGIPPDWMLLPNPIALIPDMVDLVNQVNAFLDTLESRLEATSNKFESFLAALTKEIERYVNVSTNIVDTITNVIDLLEWPDVYIGAYPFADKGGNTKLINIVGDALNDNNDPNRPPFDKGDEVLTGFVLYAGAETVGKLQAFITFIEMLVGQAKGSGASAYAEAAADIGIAVDNIEEQICLLQNLEKGICSGEEAQTSSLGPDLEPAPEENEGAECAS